MYYSLNSLKGGVYRVFMGTTIGVIEGILGVQATAHATYRILAALQTSNQHRWSSLGVRVGWACGQIWLGFRTYYCGAVKRNPVLAQRRGSMQKF